MRYDFRHSDKCNMCSTTARRTHGLRPNRSQGMRPRRVSGVAVSIIECGNCGLLFPDPVPYPENLADHYGIPPRDYWTSVTTWSEGYFESEIATAKRLINFRPGMTALDIGVGLGKGMRS